MIFATKKSRFEEMENWISCGYRMGSVRVEFNEKIQLF